MSDQSGSNGHSVIFGLAVSTVSSLIPEPWFDTGGKILMAAVVGAVGGLLHRAGSDFYVWLKRRLQKR